MPIHIESLHGGTGLRLVCSGVMRGQEVVEVHDRLLASPEQLKGCRYALIDEVAVDRVDISTAELQTVAEKDKRIAAMVPPHAVVAIIAPHDLGFGLARMWEVFAMETGWETMIFRSRADGEAWVRQKVKENFGVDLVIPPAAPAG